MIGEDAEQDDSFTACMVKEIDQALRRMALENPNFYQKVVGPLIEIIVKAFTLAYQEREAENEQ